MEWKELEIGNVPHDILTGGYEWQVYDCITRGWIQSRYQNGYDIIEVTRTGSRYRYRKPEPKQPTHEEIMTKWWLLEDEWQKVVGYDTNLERYFKGEDWDNKKWFIGKESADIPPEE